MILFQSVLACPIASLFAAKRCPDGVSISSRPSPAPAVAASAAGRGNEISRPDLGDRDRLPAQAPAMDTENRTDSLASGRHTHVSKSSGPITATVLHYVRCLHPAKRFENLAKIAPGDIARQVTYTDIHSVPLFICIEHLPLDGVLNREK